MRGKLVRITELLQLLQQSRRPAQRRVAQQPALQDAAQAGDAGALLQPLVERHRALPRDTRAAHHPVLAEQIQRPVAQLRVDEGRGRGFELLDQILRGQPPQFRDGARHRLGHPPRRRRLRHQAGHRHDGAHQRTETPAQHPAVAFGMVEWIAPAEGPLAEGVRARQHADGVQGREPELADELALVDPRRRIEEEHRGIGVHRRLARLGVTVDEGTLGGVAVLHRQRGDAGGVDDGHPLHRRRRQEPVDVGDLRHGAADVDQHAVVEHSPAAAAVVAHDLRPRGGAVAEDGDGVGGLQGARRRDVLADQGVDQRRLARLEPADDQHPRRREQDPAQPVGVVRQIAAAGGQRVQRPVDFPRDGVHGLGVHVRAVLHQRPTPLNVPADVARSPRIFATISLFRFSRASVWRRSSSEARAAARASSMRRLSSSPSRRSRAR